MKVGFKDFRCFHNPPLVDIRPITLLVGENSAGKTSFLAGTRFVFELFSRKQLPSFNKEPFQLGSFDQIAHYRGGKFGRAKNFSFSVQGEVSSKIHHGSSRDLFFEHESGHSLGLFNLSVSFKDNKGQPTLSSVEFQCGPYNFAANFGQSFEIFISTPSSKSVRYSESVLEDIDSTQFSISYLEFLLRDFRFMVGRSSDGEREEPTDVKTDVERSPISKLFLEEVRFLSDLYRRSIRTLPDEVYASAPVRSKPERTYNPSDFTHLPDGGHVPYVLAQLKAFDPKSSEEIERSLSAFGKASGLFERVQVQQIGKTSSGPFQLIVTFPNRKSNIADVGYGVSQALPIVTDMLRMKATTFLFQQPEVHLHPRAQAELGTFIVNVAKQRRHTVIVETHSDYLIDRVREEVRKGERVKPEDVVILYFSRQGHDVGIHPITFDKMGNTVGAPDDYRKFFLEEEMRVLGIETL
jgi:AAA ATPase domain